MLNSLIKVSGFSLFYDVEYTVLFEHCVSILSLPFNLAWIWDLGKSFRSKIGGFKTFNLLNLSIKIRGFSLFYDVFHLYLIPPENDVGSLNLPWLCALSMVKLRCIFRLFLSQKESSSFLQLCETKIKVLRSKSRTALQSALKRSVMNYDRSEVAKSFLIQSYLNKQIASTA